MHSYASSAGTVGVALGLALVNEAASCDTLAHAPSVPVAELEEVADGVVATLEVGVAVLVAAGELLYGNVQGQVGLAG